MRPGGRSRAAAKPRGSAGNDFVVSNAGVTQRARRIAELLRRYAGSTWRLDREHAAMPPHYAGTAQVQLWRAFKTGAAMPLGERQLRTILGD